MKKRMISFWVAVNILFAMTGIRLFVLCTNSISADTALSLRNKTIDVKRGNIYDRNLMLFTNESSSFTALINPSPAALNHLRGLNAPESLKKEVADGYFLIKEQANDDFYKNCEDIKLIKTFTRYTNDSAIHILGYQNASGEGICGIEYFYNGFLTENGGEISASYSADARGRVMVNEDITIRDSNYYSPVGIALTIDKNLQFILEETMKKGNIDKGAGIILDIKTGEILACASTPSYSRNNLSKALNDSNSPFINRAFCAYPVGSVFKVVTASAAIENNTLPSNFKCTGKTVKSNNTFLCSNLSGHKEIDLYSALSKSCNPYFIETGVLTGADKLLSTAKSFHLGESINLAEGYETAAGTLPDLNDLKWEADIGNFAFGQGKLTATPLQICTVFSAICNNGIYVKPSLIKGTVNNEGKLIEEEKTKGERILNEAACEEIKKGLILTTVDGTGKLAHSPYLSSYSKTATAQSGQIGSDGKEIKYCWFVGCFPAENPQYTVCIMKENGNTGGADCGPVFKEVAERMMRE